MKVTNQGSLQDLMEFTRSLDPVQTQKEKRRNEVHDELMSQLDAFCDDKWFNKALIRHREALLEEAAERRRRLLAIYQTPADGESVAPPVHEHKSLRVVVLTVAAAMRAQRALSKPIKVERQSVASVELSAEEPQALEAKWAKRAPPTVLRLHPVVDQPEAAPSEASVASVAPLPAPPAATASHRPLRRTLNRQNSMRSSVQHLASQLYQRSETCRKSFGSADEHSDDDVEQV
jgi:hypothetical protein